MTDRNKEVLRQFWRVVWEERNPGLGVPLLTEDVQLHVSGADFGGRDSLGAAITERWFGPFPDLTVSIDQQLAEGDRVADRVIFKGTHSGTPFLPGVFRLRGLQPIPARGLPFEFTQTTIYRFQDGLIAEIWEDFDQLRLLLQLGVDLVVPTG